MNRTLSPEEIAASLKAELDAVREREEKLKADNQALIDEFSNAGTADEVLKTTQNQVKDMVPTALGTIKQLMETGETESVRAGLAKFVVSAVLDSKTDPEGTSEIREFLKSLQKEPTVSE